MKTFRFGLSPGEAIDRLRADDATLKVCDLSGNAVVQMRFHEILPALTEALAANRCCEELNLGGCALDDEACVHVAAALRKNATLTKLGLQHNRINNEGAVHLARALCTNRGLAELNLLGQKGPQAAYGDATLAEYLAVFETNVSLRKIVWRLDSRQSFRLTKMLTRNCDIERRRRAGIEYEHLIPPGAERLLPRGRPLPAAPPSQTTSGQSPRAPPPLDEPLPQPPTAAGPPLAPPPPVVVAADDDETGEQPPPAAPGSAPKTPKGVLSGTIRQDIAEEQAIKEQAAKEQCTRASGGKAGGNGCDESADGSLPHAARPSERRAGPQALPTAQGLPPPAQLAPAMPEPPLVAASAMSSPAPIAATKSTGAGSSCAALRVWLACSSCQQATKEGLRRCLLTQVALEVGEDGALRVVSRGQATSDGNSPAPYSPLTSARQPPAPPPPSPREPTPEPSPTPREPTPQLSTSPRVVHAGRGGRGGRGRPRIIHLVPE